MVKGKQLKRLEEFEMLYDNGSSTKGLTVEDIVRANNRKSITKESIKNLVNRAKMNAF